MNISAQQEQFSNAYLQAVATVAGYNLAKYNVDDDSIDWLISGKSSTGCNIRPKLQVQLKCSRRENSINERSVPYTIKKKNYDDLRIDEGIPIPRILVVVRVPPEVENWIDHSEERLLIKHCAYWISLKGRPERDSEHDVSITIPRANIFSAETLTTLMTNISNGVMP